MPKTVKLDPINEKVDILTNDNLLSGLLAKDLNVWKECGGRGMCSTCHVFITDGMESLSPVNRREIRTMEVITIAGKCSRLACQARVIGDGVVVEVPSGMYVNEIDNIEDLIGSRAKDNILHPITGALLVEKDKLVTRTMITQLKDTQVEVAEYMAKVQDA